jgi:hypothetical protein
MAIDSDRLAWKPVPLMLRLLVAVAFAAALFSYWSIPLKLAFGPGGSYYTCCYIPDELYYIQRAEPLIAGTGATNTINGLRDPAVISPYYLEDLCRAFVSITGIHVITFVWAWRILFPLVMAMLLFLIARECLPRSSGTTLQFASAALTLVLIPCCYDLVTDYPVPQLFINRVFTNAEYPLSLLIALLTLRLLRRPTAWRGISLSLASAAATYFRIYLALAWCVPVILATLLLLLKRRLSLRNGCLMLGSLVVTLLPWVWINSIDKRSPAFEEMLLRTFEDTPYQIHPHTMLYLSIALLLVIAGKFVAGRFRLFCFSSALAMAAFPFVSGIFWFNAEIVLYDRFGAFYWIALSCAVIAGIATLAASRALRRNATRRNTIIAAASSIGLCAAGGIAYHNYSFQYDVNSIKHVTNFTPKTPGDSQFVAAYDWIRSNTPGDALFLNDDGYDWSLVGLQRDASGNMIISEAAPDGTSMRGKSDLFQIVAHRRQVFSEILIGSALSTGDYFALLFLQRGTFGYPLDAATYKNLLKQFRPSYILWRKKPIYPTQQPAPVPRGYGAQLKAFCTTVYVDDACEVWKINYP